MAESEEYSYFKFSAYEKNIKECENSNCEDSLIYVLIDNTKETNEQSLEHSINSIKNQTFSYCKYDLLDKIDFRKKINTIKEEFILLLDGGEVLDNTFLECAYWTLKTNNTASFCYSNQVVISEKKLENSLCVGKNIKSKNTIGNTILVRKEELINYIREIERDESSSKLSTSIVNYLLKKDKFPVRMNYYGIWKENRTNEKLASDIKDELIGINYPVGVSYYHDRPYELEWNKKNTKKDGKTNLLFIFPWFRVGGADKFNIELISRLDKNKYNITIITTEPCIYVWRQLFEEYAEIFDLPSFLHRDNWAGFIDYIIKTRKINLVMNSNSYYGFYAIPWLKSNNPEVIFTDYLHALNFTWRKGEYPTDSTAISNLLDETFVSSNEITRVMKEQMGRENDNVKTIYIGVDSNRFDPENKEIIIPEEIKYLENENDVILFCCRISDEKRPLLMLKIIENLKKEKPNIKLLVVGDGPMLDLMKEKTKLLELEENVVFMGMQEEVRPYYKLAKLLVVCSIREGITLTTYEALSMGLPVVSADVGGQKELIDNSCGRLVDNIQTIEEVSNTEYTEEEINNYANAIKEVLDDKNYAKYKEAARKKIRGHFELKQMVNKMALEFERLIKEGTKVPKELINNKPLYAQYLLLFNEIDKRYYNNPKGGFGTVSIADERRNLESEIKTKEEYIANREIQFQEIINNKDNYIREKEEELERIYNSRRWKYTDKIIKVFRKNK